MPEPAASTSEQALTLSTEPLDIDELARVLQRALLSCSPGCNVTTQ